MSDKLKPCFKVLTPPIDEIVKFLEFNNRLSAAKIADILLSYSKFHELRDINSKIAKELYTKNINFLDELDKLVDQHIQKAKMLSYQHSKEIRIITKLGI